MNERIQNKKLTDFLKIIAKNNFAEITFKCGATKFINTDLGFNDDTGEMYHTYKFNDIIFSNEKYYKEAQDSYYVLYIPSKAYLMYQIDWDEIKVWVAFTEELKRKKGYMTMLLKELVFLCQTKK